MYTKLAGGTNIENISEDQEQSNKPSEDINSLFSAYRGCGSYKILIEGEPGIGKTVLSFEIAAQWANKVLLEDKLLLFLLFMRQPETKIIADVKSLVEHFFHDDILLVNEITEWLIDSKGKHLTVVLDGYDEAFTCSVFFDFVNKLIAHEILPECGLVITSRPVNSSYLHNHVNCRAKILGFTEQSCQQFMKLYIEKQEKEKQLHQTNQQDVVEHNIKTKIEMMQKILKCNPVINSLCYMPLNATMFLLCLTESEEEIDPPATKTTLYERFIIITMKHFLHTKHNTIKLLSFKDLPYDYYQTFQQLAKFAYCVSIEMDDEKCMKLVFELDDIEMNCEKFVSHGNGLGLLKPASFLDMGIQNKYSSYNFLHKSIQEYMAAYHIASLPPSTLSTLLNQKFWDSNYISIWVMYVGITGGVQRDFKHFLSGSRFKLLALNPSKISNRVLNDKIKCLHLLQCAAEAQESNVFVAIRNIFESKVIDLSNKTLSEIDIKTLAVLLLDLPDGPWNLNLSRCNINNECCQVLFEIFASQFVATNIKTVNISFNNIHSENLYRLCHEVFKLWKTEEVILPIDTLYTSTTIQKVKDSMNILENLIQTYRLSLGNLMILHQANQSNLIVVYSDLKFIKCLQLHDCELNETTAKKLKVIIEELKGHTVGQVYFGYSIYKDHGVKILSYVIKNFPIIKFCGLNLHSKGAYLLDNASEILFQNESDPSTYLADFLVAVLQNNTEMNTQSAYLNRLSDKVKDEVKRSLGSVSSVKVLDLTNNNLTDCIADDIELVLSCNKLEEVYLSGNNFRDRGIIKIAEALQSNFVLKVFDISNNHINSIAADSIAIALANKTKLEKLYLNGNEFQAEDIIKIAINLQSNSLKTFNVSQIIINHTAINRIANILARNTQLEELYLFGNALQTNGIFEILSGLENTSTLKVFDISNNDISAEAANNIAGVISKQVRLEKLIIGGNNLQHGLIVIMNELKCHGTLKVLDISSNNADITTMDTISVVLCFQRNVENLYLGGNNLVSTRTLNVLQYFLPVVTIDISCTNTTNETESLSAVSSHVAYIQALLLIYHTDFPVINKCDYDMWSCRVPLPTARFNDIIMKLRNASKYV